MKPPRPLDLPCLRTRIPGPKSRVLARRLKRYEAPTVTMVSKDTPIFWQRAKGIHVWDVDGNRFVDMNSGFGVAALGHSAPVVTAALRAQSKLLCHAMGDVHPGDLKAALCRRLSQLTFERWTGGRGTGQCLLGKSGFEAVEAALKTARLFTRKRGVTAFQGAYHGLGYGALEMTAWREFREPFADQLGHFAQFVPYPRRGGGADAEAAALRDVEERILAIVRETGIGAILVEPFQGRAGEIIPPEGFLPMLRRLCDRHRMLLIADEIYVGFWRTGRWFGVEHSGVTPDLVCLGKALTGCLPLSACVGRAEVMAAWPESRGEAIHTSTFLGNPLACAAALASLREFECSAARWDVTGKGERFRERLCQALAGVAAVREVRGIGMMTGIEFERGAAMGPPELCARLLRRGIIALSSGPSGEVLVLAPPLITPKNMLEWCATQVGEVARSRR